MSYNPFAATGQLPAPATIVRAQSPYTALPEDNVLLCDTGGGAVAIVLPVIGIDPGKVYNIKRIGPVNAVSITVAGAGSIDGVVTTTLNTQFQVIQVVFDGLSNYFII